MFKEFGQMASLMKNLPKIREEMGKLQERVAHITAERTQSAIPQYVAPPDGCASSATPAKPMPTPASAGHGRRSRPARRSTTTHRGTEAMISEASPVGTFRSAKKSTALAPGRSAPMTMHEIRARRVIRSVPPRMCTTIAINPPATMKRVEAANSGGIVSPAYAIPR